MHDNLPKPSLLSQGHCVPCEGGEDPLTPQQYAPYLEIVNGWLLINDNHAIERDFRLHNFKQALAFVNKVGEIAEAENHHPDILIYGWNKVKIVLTTHAIKGLSINDFVLASKIDRVLL